MLRGLVGYQPWKVPAMEMSNSLPGVSLNLLSQGFPTVS